MTEAANQHAFCQLCQPPRRLPLDALWEHLRIVHDLDAEFAEWPDGSPVIIDSTLEPEDFA